MFKIKWVDGITNEEVVFRKQCWGKKNSDDKAWGIDQKYFSG